MKNLTIAQKIIALVVIGTFITIVSSSFYIYQIQKIGARSRKAIEHIQNLSDKNNALVSTTSEMQGHIQNILREKDPDKIEFLLKQKDSLNIVLSKIISGDFAHSGLGDVLNNLTATNEVIIKNALLGNQVTAQIDFIEKSSKMYPELLSSLFVFISNERHKINDEISVLASNSKRSLIWSSLLIFISVAFIITLGILIFRSILKPIQETTLILKDIAEGDGDLTKQITISSNDEIGKMAHWFNVFEERLRTMITSIALNTSTLSSASEELSATSNQIAGNADQVKTLSHNVAASVEQTTNSASSVSSSTEKMSGSIQAVATAIEEISISINEVAKNCQKEFQVSRQADIKAKSTKETIEELGTSANEIGKFIEMINDIADQTNLLALNATIEAASAGDAGKGFAVVASEVKELAKQTAQATNQINEKITDIQSKTSNAVSVIGEIAAIISEINQFSQVIVSAVEEQSATINEIASNVNGASESAIEITRNVSESAVTLTEISQSIQKVRISATDTSTGVDQIKISSQDLAAMASTLQSIIGQFKI